ncbi:MAG TPA: glycosyltransferase family 4 protein [Terriglobia bacterium]|nr:glycosyltransferase family 4 protein [Terriglobia bacterium]
MRSLYLCSDHGIDLTGLKGGSIHVRSFVRALTGLGHEVTAIGTRVSSPESFGGATGAAVVSAPLTPRNRALLRAIKSGNRFLGRSSGRGRNLVRVFHNAEFFRVADERARRWPPSFIYERYSLWGTAGQRLARKYSIPLVLEVNSPLAYEEEKYREGSGFPSLTRWAERRIWCRADLLIAVSEALLSHIERAGVKPGKIQILPNAVDTSLFRPGLDDGSLRSQLKLDGRFVVGFVGSFKAWHGADFLVSTFARLLRENAYCHLLLVGDGPMRPVLEEEVRRLGIQRAVTLVGNVPHEEVPRYLALMDVAVAPYPALEDFYFSPLKLYEYMAATRAIVASRIGQVAEVLSNGSTGLLYEPGNGEELIECLRRLQADGTLRKELGRNAHAACSKNTWRQNAERVVAWVEPLLDRKDFTTRATPKAPLLFD